MQVLDCADPTHQLVDNFSYKLKRHKYGFLSGQVLRDVFEFSEAEVQKFSDYWNRLSLDQFMGDGGLYRYRRYSALRVKDSYSDYEVLPHHAYVQPKHVNPLNGDVKREFDPIEPAMLKDPVFVKLIELLTDAFNEIEQSSKPWVVRLHPYRIHATPQSPGKPAPEGLHRDGVKYVTSVLISRNNIVGGETTVANLDRQAIHCLTLADALDVMSCDDESVLHSVSEVNQLNPEKPSWRDVLVVAFSRD